MSSPRKESATISQSMKRKTMFLLILGFALVVAWVTIITDEQLRERLGSNLYIIGFSITGCFLLLLAGYIWDQTLVKALRSLHDTTNAIQTEDIPSTGDESDSDEIIGLARQIQTQGRALPPARRGQLQGHRRGPARPHLPLQERWQDHLRQRRLRPRLESQAQRPGGRRFPIFCPGRGDRG